jgi:hypothetical protein
MQGLFIWNERQFLLDQLLLSGADPGKTIEPIPVPSNLFNQYASDYVNSEMGRSSLGGKSHSSISERIPADVLWLFRNSPQTTLIPFEIAAQTQMKIPAQRFSTNYIQLAKILLEQCLSTNASFNRHYGSIIDFRSLF